MLADGLFRRRPSEPRISVILIVEARCEDTEDENAEDKNEAHYLSEREGHLVDRNFNHEGNRALQEENWGDPTHSVEFESQDLEVPGKQHCKSLTR